MLDMGKAVTSGKDDEIKKYYEVKFQEDSTKTYEDLQAQVFLFSFLA